MPKQRELPNLSNATPEGLLDMLFQEREKQKDAKFLEGVYKEALEARLPAGTKHFESENNVGEYTDVTTERINQEAIRAAFTREELTKKGFLSVSSYRTLKITPRPKKT